MKYRTINAVLILNLLAFDSSTAKAREARMERTSE
jgi:hypothetical protein